MLRKGPQDNIYTISLESVKEIDLTVPQVTLRFIAKVSNAFLNERVIPLRF